MTLMRTPAARTGGVCLALLWCLQAAQAGPLPEAARQEIQQLLGRLEASGCQFNRNGSWYSSQDARAHLQKKLDYLADKGQLESAEQFIERAASKSSMSGKPYWVQCTNTPQQESAAWLGAQLKLVRQPAR
jgi:hypothetical protein